MAEKRLIDANALDEKLEILKVRFKAQGRKAVAEDYNFVQTVLLTAPTVDAVEVVRCKDCKSYCHIIGKGDRAIFGCSYMGRDVKPDDFCPYGERRTDG